MFHVVWLCEAWRLKSFSPFFGRGQVRAEFPFLFFQKGSGKSPFRGRHEWVVTKDQSGNALDEGDLAV